MPEQKIQTLPEPDALEQIVETIQQADKGEAPFALVLGSGFSHGLVPTTKELVSESLPLWIKSLKEGKPFETQSQLPADERTDIARSFWKVFVEKNSPPPRGLDLPLNSVTGLPEDYAEAYKAAFTPAYTGAVGAPAQARKFQRALMQLHKPRLNAAHFLLASLLGVQPGKSRESSLFKAHAAFCRLILTTNFDPFLQTALQAVNRLYFMSDTPELGVSDDIFDDQTDAIHLVYLHGSIHRRSQAATEEDIKALKERNARTLAPVLKRHGIIVLGYSGWDDAIVEALAASDRFDNRLYWCGLEPDPLAKGAFGPRVADILRKPAALYVQSAGAGSFMAQLLSRLVEGLPRLLDNPIGQLRELLDIIDLKELAELKPPVSSGPNTPQLLQSASAATAFVQAKQSTIERLRHAEQVFLGMISGVPVVEKLTEPEPETDGEMTGVPEMGSESKIQQLLSSAQLALGLGNSEECLKLADEALTLTNLGAADKSKLLILRALAHYFLGSADAAIKDWGQAIELPGAPVEQLAEALYNRGVTWGQQGDTEKEIADYTRVIELPDVPVEQAAEALYNRGVTWGKNGDTEKEIADYTRLIELPGAPVKQLVDALFNRGVTWGKKGDTEKQIADYTRVIEQLPEVPIDDVAQALVNRGVTWGKKGDTEKEIADYTRVIEQLPGAPVEQVAQALFNRGIAWGKKHDIEKEIADYTRLIELPGAPLDQVAQGLYNRGIAWGKNGFSEREIADYTRVIERPRGPVDQVGRALGSRGWAKYLTNDFAGFLADTEAALKNQPELDFAAFNLGLALLASGRDVEALEAYRAAGEQFPESIGDLGLNDLEEAKKSWLTEERARPVMHLLQSLRK